MKQKIGIYLGHWAPLTNDMLHQIISDHFDVDQIVIALVAHQCDQCYYHMNMSPDEVEDEIKNTLRPIQIPIDVFHLNIGLADIDNYDNGKFGRLFAQGVYRYQHEKAEPVEYELTVIEGDKIPELPESWTKYKVNKHVYTPDYDIMQFLMDPREFNELMPVTFRSNFNKRICVTGMNPRTTAEFCCLCSLGTHIPYIETESDHFGPYIIYKNPELDSYLSTDFDMFLDKCKEVFQMEKDNFPDTHCFINRVDPLLEYCKYIEVAKINPGCTDGMTPESIEEKYKAKVMDLCKQLNYDNIFIYTTLEATAPDPKMERLNSKPVGERPPAPAVTILYQNLCNEVYGYDPVVLPDAPADAYRTLHSIL